VSNLRSLVLFGFLATTSLAWCTSALASEKARVITSEGRTVQCISPISINQIDGRQVNVRPMFDLEPGPHKLMGRASINVANCPAVRGNPRYEVAPLEASFEAGTTYYVGLDHSSTNLNEWKVVIWKTD
jgi:hypothetical protein